MTKLKVASRNSATAHNTSRPSQSSFPYLEHVHVAAARSDLHRYCFHTSVTESVLLLRYRLLPLLRRLYQVSNPITIVCRKPELLKCSILANKPCKSCVSAPQPERRSKALSGADIHNTMSQPGVQAWLIHKHQTLIEKFEDEII